MLGIALLKDQSLFQYQHFPNAEAVNNSQVSHVGGSYNMRPESSPLYWWPIVHTVDQLVR